MEETELRVVTNKHLFAECLDEVTVCSIGGLLQFVQYAFGNNPSRLYGQIVTREPEGKGPHFDVYQDILDDDFPYIGIFNLTGSADLRVTVLSFELAKAYRGAFPKPTPEALEARKLFGQLAFAASDIEVAKVRIQPDYGIIIPQRDKHYVHDIKPVFPSSGGKYVKLVMINSEDEAEDAIRDAGYEQFDELVTNTLAAEPIVITLPAKPNKIGPFTPQPAPYPLQPYDYWKHDQPNSWGGTYD